MERHCDNALAVANWLNKHDAVEWVSFAGLPDSPYFELAQKYTNGRPSALLTFGEGGFEAGVKFYDALQLFSGWSTSVMPNRWLRIRPRQPTDS